MRVVLKSPKALRFCMVSVASLVAFFLAALLVRDLLIHQEDERDADIKQMIFFKGNRTVITSRKLLQSAGMRNLSYFQSYINKADDGDTNRIGTGCSKDDIVIYQDQLPPLSNGIPEYTVEITNMCANDCNIANIRVHCGWFSSARLINPSVFRRLGYDDCLVNDGMALGPGRTISFQYANTFRYPLSVSSVVCFS
ncbi:TPD1 protein homolog 1-like [Gastrolobium bilobum]|uniref:TPD1 protein homolog 1-like n=1 Tax=Gastrolobium bilobum TaxID=150636 RepID=UPI002AB15E2E|nr:TPD1 protein homolog 1-like [Gastrolobium bilobum]